MLAVPPLAYHNRAGTSFGLWGATGSYRCRVVVLIKILVVKKRVAQGELAKQIEHSGKDKDDDNKYKDAIPCGLLQLQAKKYFLLMPGFSAPNPPFSTPNAARS